MELNYLKTLEKESGGFNYDNSIRNDALIASKPENQKSLQYTKTGTTICGVVFKVSFYKSYQDLMLTIFSGRCCYRC